MSVIYRSSRSCRRGRPARTPKLIARRGRHFAHALGLALGAELVGRIGFRPLLLALGAGLLVTAVALGRAPAGPS
ncbi:hypothetical protein [Streptomyces sp. NPDC057403]|uniref:hypothetical protein n=1 Tax=Streptomyces sp. NPDC057403 TaxID=3346119 RepID=UPI0036C214C4